MKLEVVVTSAKVIKCSFLLQCAKTFNSNPGNPIHTENPSLANQSSFGKENRFIKTREPRSFHGAEQSGKRSIHKGVSYGFRPSLFPRKLHMFMKYGPKVQTSFTTQSCTHQGLISKKNKSSRAALDDPPSLGDQRPLLRQNFTRLSIGAVVEIRSPPGSSPIMPFYCPDNHVIT